MSGGAICRWDGTKWDGTRFIGEIGNVEVDFFVNPPEGLNSSLVYTAFEEAAAMIEGMAAVSLERVAHAGDADIAIEFGRIDSRGSTLAWSELPCGPDRRLRQMYGHRRALGIRHAAVSRSCQPGSDRGPRADARYGPAACTNIEFADVGPLQPGGDHASTVGNQRDAQAVRPSNYKIARWAWVGVRQWGWTSRRAACGKAARRRGRLRRSVEASRVMKSISEFIAAYEPQPSDFLVVLVALWLGHVLFVIVFPSFEEFTERFFVPLMVVLALIATIWSICEFVPLLLGP